MSSLATLEAEMAGLHDAAAPSPVAEQLLLAARTARSLLDQHEARLVAILDRHANHGSGPCPEEVFAASGCSSHEARAAAGRARILIGLNNSLTDTVADSLVGDADDAHPSDQDTDHSGTNGATSGGSNDDNASDGSDSSNAGSFGFGGDERATGNRGFGDRPAGPPFNAENLDAIRRAEKQFKTETERAAFAKRMPELADLAASLSPREFSARLKKIIFAITSELGIPLKERQRRDSRLKYWTDKDGMLQLHGQFDPERGSIIAASLDRELRTEAQQARSAENKTLALDDNLAASALHRICDRAFDPERKTSRPLVGLLVDLQTLQFGEHDNTVSEMMSTAEWVDDATRRRWLCDCDLQKVVTDSKGLPVNVGRTYRTATPAQRLALRAMYRTCGFPGCDCPFDWCQSHHIEFWEVGGPTDLENLIPLCTRHHHLVHEGGWRLTLEPGRTAVAYRPDGAAHGRGVPDGPLQRSPLDQHDRDRRAVRVETDRLRLDLFDEREPSHN